MSDNIWEVSDAEYDVDSISDFDLLNQQNNKLKNLLNMNKMNRFMKMNQNIRKNM